MSEMISNTTCTRCQSCGEWTNYAGDPHHRERMARLDRLAALEQRVRELADHFAGMPGKIDEEVAAEHLRALLNPSASHGTEETP